MNYLCLSLCNAFITQTLRNTKSLVKSQINKIKKIGDIIRLLNPSKKIFKLSILIR